MNCVARKVIRRFHITNNLAKSDMLSKHAKIFVAGHRGMVGSALVRRLGRDGFGNLLLRSRNELDLSDSERVHDFMHKMKPDYVILAAAKVGGILANNSLRADFIYENLAIEINTIHAAYDAGVRRLLFLGSSCIYPRECPQPIKEEYLLTGPLEKTNEPYAIAKIAGIKLCESYNRQYGTEYISVMPTNLYGPHDNFNLNTSHVVPALVRKMHEAKLAKQNSVQVWGTGNPLREFLHVDDLADACVFLMQQDIRDEIMNVGVGEDITIRQLAELIRSTVGFGGELNFDDSKPDGTPKKLLDSSKINSLGWKPKYTLADGIQNLYKWYVSNFHTTFSTYTDV